MSDPDRLTGCGCCAGTDVETPARIENPPGLSAVAYRAGVHARFKQSITARLSGSARPALNGLRERGDDDFTIALADGFAVMADVLTFYQERLANESFLRTATERGSVLQLARLIGYELAPGVAADTWLAFLLDEAPGQPSQAALPVTIPAGTKVQSVPGTDEAPQLFETIAPIEARVERNAIRVQTRIPQRIDSGLKELFLAGTGHQLSAGDVIVIVGRERESFKNSEQWDVRLLRSVEADDRRGLTRLTWAEGLGHTSPTVRPALDDPKVFVFRQRAALFGHNAQDARLLAGVGLSALADLATGRWKNFELSGTHVDLDQPYPRVVPGGWIALVSPGIHHLPSSLAGYVELYGVETVSNPSVSAYGLSGKVTRIDLDTGEHLTWFDRRETYVLAQSERLPLGEQPLRNPVYGLDLALASIVPDLTLGGVLAVTGRRQHIRIRSNAAALTFVRDDGSRAPLTRGDRLAILEPPARVLAGGALQGLSPTELVAAIDGAGTAPLRWRVADRDGTRGTFVSGAINVAFDAVRDDDAQVSEIVFIGSLADSIRHDRDRTLLRLASALRHCYDPESVLINGNVAPATHGETVSEPMGSGDASQPDQRFVLKQSPLTYVSADTPSGRRSTLDVRVAGAGWNEVPSLFEASADARIFTTRQDELGRTTVIFGDGVEGARLPTAPQNLRATYRKGLGTEGNVRANQLTTLLTRPLGVTSASNPEPASGGQDPEPLDGARRNAPLTVLTLDRAVSVRDYEDLSRGFAGVTKAHALWIDSGPARGVFITVAGPAGAAILPSSKTHRSLLGSLRNHGDALVPLTLRSYRPAAFELKANIKVSADRLADDVMQAARDAVIAAFAFDVRGFGQAVTQDEVVAVFHRVEGIEAVDINMLRRLDQPVPVIRPRLFAAMPVVSGATVTAAELLTLHVPTLEVGVMP